MEKLQFQANNVVILEGTIDSFFEYDHSWKGQRFYNFKLAVKRPSGAIDYVPCSVSNKIIGNIRDWRGREIKIIGKFNHYVKKLENGCQSIVQVNVLNMELISKKEVHENNILLIGKVTSVSKTKITDKGRMFTCIKVSVKKNNNKRCFFSVIVWNDMLDENKKIEEGLNIKLVGRIFVKVVNGSNICEVETKAIELSEEIEELAS